MPHLPFDASPPFKGKSTRGLYGDVVEELDDSTGRILDKLRALGLAENTLVLFTSDNGPERNTPGTAAPLRGTKHTVYEGGLRVPCIAWWPGHVPAGRVCREFLTTLEIFPTLAGLTGADLPGALNLDGFDVSSLLLGQPDAHSPRTTLYSLYGFGVRYTTLTVRAFTETFPTFTPTFASFLLFFWIQNGYILLASEPTPKVIWSINCHSGLLSFAFNAPDIRPVPVRFIGGQGVYQAFGFFWPTG